MRKTFKTLRRVSEFNLVVSIRLRLFRADVSTALKEDLKVAHITISWW